MSSKNTLVDTYFAEGCGRCSFWATPQCKVHRWQDEMQLLRKLLLDCGLTEEVKWGVPCYTFQNKNIIILSAFKDYCGISFFKGALLKDDHKLLEKPGENTQSARIMRFTSVAQIKGIESFLDAYLYEAIEVEKAGLKVKSKQALKGEMPAELQMKFEALPVLQTAFNALTPGKQRAYILYFSSPSQSKTRTSRIEKCIAQILDGKGLHDAYKQR